MKARFSLFIVLLWMVVAQGALASEISIRPFLIDLTLVPRESATESIVLTSEYPARKAIIYATVNEISVGTNGEIKEFISPVMTDRTNTVTSWVEISRGRIELPAGETTEIPLTVKVHPFAEPGEYHVFIGFVETKKRDAAEQIAKSGDADGVIVKITIVDERKDSMRISSMAIDRLVTNREEQQVSITVENSGEFESAPAGEVIFYNRRGYEVAALPVNTSGETVAAGSNKTFVVPVPDEVEIGRFKANANLLYGEKQQASLFDSVSFYKFPLIYMYVAIGFLLLLLLLLFYLFRKNNQVVFTAESGDDIPVFIRDGHNPVPKDHDIDLSK
jgi:hypothetical protein